MATAKISQTIRLTQEQYDGIYRESPKNMHAFILHCIDKELAARTKGAKK